MYKHIYKKSYLLIYQYFKKIYYLNKIHIVAYYLQLIMCIII